MELALTGPGTQTPSVSFFAVALNSETQFTAIELNTNFPLLSFGLPVKPHPFDLSPYPMLFNDLRQAYVSPSRRQPTTVVNAKPLHTAQFDITSFTLTSPPPAWGFRPMLCYKVAAKIEGPTILAYTHRLRRDGLLYIPTAVTATLNTLYTINTPRGSGLVCGNPGVAGIIRLDLLTQPRIRFPRISLLRRLVLSDFVTSGSPPTSSYIPSRPPDPRARDYIAIDGTIFNDLTNLHVVRFEPYHNKTYPIVCGCYLTEGNGSDPFYFTGHQFTFIEKRNLLHLVEFKAAGLPLLYEIVPGNWKICHGKHLLPYKAASASSSDGSQPPSFVPPVL